MTFAYESSVVRVGDTVAKRLFVPMLVGTVPWMVMAPFEVYFAVRRYRSLRREMEGRTAAS